MRIMGGEAKLLATRVQGRTRHGPCQLERPPTYRARAPAWSSDAKEKQQKSSGHLEQGRPETNAQSDLRGGGLNFCASHRKNRPKHAHAAASFGFALLWLRWPIDWAADTSTSLAVQHQPICCRSEGGGAKARGGHTWLTHIQSAASTLRTQLREHVHSLR